MHVVALECDDLKREGWMTDKNGIITHHIDAWERSEPRLWWCSNKPSAGYWVPGPPNNLTFCLEKDGDSWIPMGVRGLIHAHPPHGRGVTVPAGVSYCGRFPVVACVEKNQPHELESHSMASRLVRHSPPIRVEWHGCDRTTDDGQDQCSQGSDKPSGTLSVLFGFVSWTTY